MTPPNSTPLDEHLPPARLVRWLLLAGVILFSVGLYFRFGLKVQPLGTAAPPATTTAP
jgi:hypothetical protein